MLRDKIFMHINYLRSDKLPFEFSPNLGLVGLTQDAE